MTQARPKISVVVTAFNKEAFIAECVRSVLAQSEPSLEVVIVDDCSTDGTRDVVSRLSAADERIRLIALPRNGGQPAAINVGITSARGEWVAMLDGDDWVGPNLYRDLLALADKADASVVASNMQWVDDGRIHRWRTLLPTGGAWPKLLTAAQFIRRSMPHQVRPLSFLQPLVRRDVWIKHNIRCDETDPYDMDFGIMVLSTLAGGKVAILRDPAYFYRQVPGSMMSIRGPDILRLTKASNDALLPWCERFGETEAATLIEKRSLAVQREIDLADLVADIRCCDWRLVGERVIRHPTLPLTLAWRRVRAPLHRFWRRWLARDSRIEPDE